LKLNISDYYANTVRSDEVIFVIKLNDKIMSKPMVHAKNSVRRWGGSFDDYIEIHELLDSSKVALGDNRHRALTHNTWFISTIIERIFGRSIINSDGREISTKDIAEQHVLEDYGMKFIPTAQDFLQNIPHEPWMNGHGLPPSRNCITTTETKTI
jgi:hypothetical protein